MLLCREEIARDAQIVFAIHPQTTSHDSMVLWSPHTAAWPLFVAQLQLTFSGKSRQIPGQFNYKFEPAPKWSTRMRWLMTLFIAMINMHIRWACDAFVWIVFRWTRPPLQLMADTFNRILIKRKLDRELDTKWLNRKPRARRMWHAALWAKWSLKLCSVRSVVANSMRASQINE